MPKTFLVSLRQYCQRLERARQIRENVALDTDAALPILAGSGAISAPVITYTCMPMDVGCEYHAGWSALPKHESSPPCTVGRRILDSMHLARVGEVDWVARARWSSSSSSSSSNGIADSAAGQYKKAHSRLDQAANRHGLPACLSVIEGRGISASRSIPVPQTMRPSP